MATKTNRKSPLAEKAGAGMGNAGQDEPRKNAAVPEETPRKDAAIPEETPRELTAVPEEMPQALPPLKGLRREMDRKMFEDLAGLQCEIPEILGYVGTTREKLARWCRKHYRLPLEKVLEMVRQDGLVEIRRASFELLKKSAPLIQQQYNRFLTAPADSSAENAKRLAREIFSLEEPEAKAVQELFGEE